MGWQEGISIPTRERCGVCHHVSPVGFSVPDGVWQTAVPEYFAQAVMCIGCFASFADERMIAWDAKIEFWPVSLRTHLNGFETPPILSTGCEWTKERLVRLEAASCEGCDMHSRDCGGPDFCCAACPFLHLKYAGEQF